MVSLWFCLSARIAFCLSVIQYLYDIDILAGSVLLFMKPAAGILLWHPIRWDRSNDATGSDDTCWGR